MGAIPQPNTPDFKSGLSGTESMAFHKLASKNSALLALVSGLDLVEVASTTIKPEPLPPLVERIPTESMNPKLEAIAQRSFARARSYTESEAIERLASVTDVTPDRARNGLAMMYAQGILSLTLSNEYYLTESTPF
ncbi:hypothetical protein CWM47_37495 [Spirosoma pollinicola]|uniref:Uncharacterized protein n=1 Tax=Spirosoma pollinicola TaxID=2057025 RepID=A0A2K8ZAX1_9BACT|nr:hypothetical protein CWM47_37495 [Spirosoma pollinicola]